MRQFIKRALQKLNKITIEQTRDLLISAAAEIDRLETVLDSLTEGILVCDTEHYLILANKCAERLLPMISYEQGSDPIWRLVRNEEIAEFFEEALRSGDRVEGREFDLEIKGLQRLLSISLTPLVQDHQVTGTLIHAEDITEKRSKEAQFRRVENLASLTTVAAGVAHEIKNPLGSLSIHIQLIQKTMAANRDLFAQARPRGAAGDGGDPRSYLDQMDRYLAVVNEEIDRLNHIVVDFLFAVRPMNMELREGDINILLKEMIEFVGYELEEARIACVLDLGENLPQISFDERYLKQAFLNLIKNAIAAMPTGGTLTIRTEVKEGEFWISVSDTGTGIPEALIAKIFEPYFTTKETGSGLGLTLVFKIVREHRGDIAVKSREGEGTRFTIMLPIPQKERRLIASPGEARAFAEESGGSHAV
ncbi:MAG: PAS domain-containing protein [Treponema sp.]|jgi:PAS domain S-box-containing protein|nr:PAS domain-containing protein [Treponema sp.]